MYNTNASKKAVIFMSKYNFPRYYINEALNVSFDTFDSTGIADKLLAKPVSDVLSFSAFAITDQLRT